eukprot:852030-Rhodomonas_salina.4
MGLKAGYEIHGTDVVCGAARIDENVAGTTVEDAGSLLALTMGAIEAAQFNDYKDDQVAADARAVPSLVLKQQVMVPGEAVCGPVRASERVSGVCPWQGTQHHSGLDRAIWVRKIECHGGVEPDVQPRTAHPDQREYQTPRVSAPQAVRREQARQFVGQSRGGFSVHGRIQWVLPPLVESGVRDALSGMDIGFDATPSRCLALT